tara:strand:- start:12635 stop:13990 length:1356 start_codon:yes stop_codon:yes gene_type:complete
MAIKEQRIPSHVIKSELTKVPLRGKEGLSGPLFTKHFPGEAKAMSRMSKSELVDKIADKIQSTSEPKKTLESMLKGSAPEETPSQGPKTKSESPSKSKEKHMEDLHGMTKEMAKGLAELFDPSGPIAKDDWELVTTTGVIAPTKLLEGVQDEMKRSQARDSGLLAGQMHLHHRVESIENDKSSGSAPDYHIIKIEKQGKVHTIEGEHVHPMYKKVFRELRTLKQVWLCGPAGTGKTFMASQISNAMDLPFASISCSAGMSEAHVLGRMNIKGQFLSTDFINIYENGGVFLFDEVDNADANVMTTLNSALANGKVSVPNRVDKPYAIRHKNAHIICASNTWGNGYGTGQGATYVREMLDSAFKDRFVAGKSFIDYDTDFEKKVTSKLPQLFTALTDLRANVQKYNLDKVVSTRAFIQGAQLMQGESYSLDKVMKNVLIDYTQEEKKKALQQS